MRISLFGSHDRAFAHDPRRRGYHVFYRANEVNHCPGCGRSHWYIGRLSAECGFCGTALPLQGTLAHGPGLFRTRGRSLGGFAAA